MISKSSGFDQPISAIGTGDGMQIDKSEHLEMPSTRKVSSDILAIS
jgi:hypothetical protein